MTSAAYPSGLDALANPTATSDCDDPGFELDLVISRIQDILEALEAKVGIGASLPSSAGVLRRTAPGVTAWGQIAAGDYAPGSIAAGDIATGATLVKIAQIGPLGAPTTFLDFTSIPQTFGVLRLYFQVRSSAAGASDSMFTVLNSSSTGIYYGVRMFGAGSTASAAENSIGATSGLLAIVPAAGAVASWAGGGVIDFPGYASATFAKTWMATSGLTWGVSAGNSQITVWHGLANLAAGISTIRLALSSAGNFVAGSYAALYGM